MTKRCLWCGDPLDSEMDWCKLCLASTANPNNDAARKQAHEDR